MFSRHVLEPGSPDLHGLCETLGCLSPVWFSFSSLVDCLLNVALEKNRIRTSQDLLVATLLKF